jgi:autoinducer 2-degrading protein
MTEAIYWILEANIKPGKLDALKSLAQAFSESTQKYEQGALIYEWSINESSDTLHIFERFENNEAALIHLANVGPKLPELMETVDLQSIKCHGPVSEAFKDACEGMPIRYFEVFSGFAR